MIIYRMRRLADEFVTYFHDGPHEQLWPLAEVAPLADHWSGLKVTVWTRDADDRRELPWPNVGSLTPYAPVLDERALEALRHLLGEVELLPLDIAGGRHWLMHFLEQPLCLDTDASEIMWSQATPSPAHIFKYVFRPECVAGRHLFLVPEMCGKELYASDEFKRAVEGAGLTGLGFKEIWRSE